MTVGMIICGVRQRGLAEGLVLVLRESYRKHSVSPPPTILSKTVNDVPSIIAH